MNGFITLPCVGSKAHIALWEEIEDGSLELVSVHRDLDEIPNHDDFPVYRFEMPTTFDTGGSINEGRYPVADADGKPLWAGCRIEFNLPSHYINTVDGKGELKNVDMYGGAYFVSDQPMNVYDRQGFIIDKRCNQYTSCNTYQYGGDFKGFRLMNGKLGDPHEHGQVEVHIRLADDPRRVCELLSRPASQPR
jgi:hypothetical protein